MTNSSRNFYQALAVQGQGLIETLFVFLIISGGVLALMSFQHYLSINTSFSQQESIANIVGTNEMESLRNFTVVNVTAGYTAYASIASGSGSSIVGNTTYTLTWTVTSNTSPTYKTINLTVSWTDRNGTARSINLVTDVAGADPGAAASII